MKPLTKKIIVLSIIFVFIISTFAGFLYNSITSGSNIYSGDDVSICNGRCKYYGYLPYTFHEIDTIPRQATDTNRIRNYVHRCLCLQTVNESWSNYTHEQIELSFDDRWRRIDLGDVKMYIDDQFKPADLFKK